MPRAMRSGLGSSSALLRVNLLESVNNPSGVLESLGRIVEAGGNLVVVVPQGPQLFSPLDQGLGQKRRFTLAELAGMLGAAGFEVVEQREFNKIGSLSWWFSGKVLAQRKARHVDGLGRAHIVQRRRQPDQPHAQLLEHPGDGAGDADAAAAGVLQVRPPRAASSAEERSGHTEKRE